MTALVFVGTNVLLQATDARGPGKQVRAKAWLDHLWRERAGRISTQVISEFYSNVRRAA